MSLIGLSLFSNPALLRLSKEVLNGLRGFGEMTDQEMELELNEAGTHLGDPRARSTTCWGFSMKLLYQKGRMTKNKVVDSLLPPDFEAKVAKLTELGFGRDAVIQALQLFNGNEEQLLLGHL
ncbi:hypothetical protein Syun_027796 [Stephania yunnanensis]|uniref:UBA domain-containing protein n=1 Tax=Stephania yunnanensis TaxID=152371 RepID=A0AAP0EIM6_9MAGN